MHFNAPLLTIVVPTFNRVANLDLLLRTLAAEVGPLKDRVLVLVADNASTDNTQEIVRAIQADWPELTSVARPQNLGADGNFCDCVERVSTRYFWIIGDDDLPKRGVIAKLVELLADSLPALVYMQSDWVKSIESADQGRPVDELHIDLLDGATFAHRVHIWLTFISGVIIDRQMLLEALRGQTIRRFSGSSLVQLGWIFPLLATGGRFALVNNPCVLATKDNSGGYPVLTVFGIRFARIAHEVFGRGSSLARALIDGNIRYYLPTPVWQSRRGAKAGFEKEDPWLPMLNELRESPWFWILIYPISRFPRIVAAPLYQFWRVLNRLRTEFQKRRTGTSIQPPTTSSPR